jgi:tetratricopeptide (TPR) repeat protein
MRKQIAILLSILTFLPLHLIFGFCAIKNDPIFAFVRVAEGTGTAQALEWSPEMREQRRAVARRVYEDLVRARGDARLPVPDFKMDAATRYVAWMDPESRSIGLEEQAYEVCRSFGADSLRAMAALLAHELTHYYERHGWIRYFAEEQPGLAVNKKWEQEEPGILYEIQADYLGGFLAYSAGYPTFGIMPELLNRLYEAYGLPAETEGYPSLEERRKRAQRAEDKVRDLADVFDMATLLTTIQEYSDARQYLDHVLNSFQSRELYNNLGVITVLEALAYFDRDEVPLGLPLELDAGSRLRDGLRASGSFDERVERRRQLLEKATRYFGQASGMDEMYPAALINMGCVNYLRGELEDAAFYARRAARMSERLEMNKALADAWVLQGIISSADGADSEAIQLFEKAAILGSNLGRFNASVLSKTVVAVPAVQRERRGFENIGALSLDEFLAAPDVAKQIQVAGNTILGVEPRESSILYLNYVDDGRRYALFQQTGKGYSGKTYHGIQTGDPRNTIVEQYGAPERIVELAQGRVLVYPVQRILFFLDEQDRLESWVLFRLGEGG